MVGLSVHLDLKLVSGVVNDLDDGRYQICFDNLIEGQYQLDIFVDNVNLGDSPFNVYVQDYAAMKSPVAGVKINGRPRCVDTGPGNLQYVSTWENSIEVFRNNYFVSRITPSKLSTSCRLRGIAVDKQNKIMFEVDTNTHQVIKNPQPVL